MGTVHCLVYFNLFHCDGLIVLICSPYFSVSECDKVLRMVDVLKSEWTAFMSSRGLAGLARFSRGCEHEYQPGIWRVGCLISVCVGSQLSRMLYSPNAICLCMCEKQCVSKFGSWDRPKDELDCTSAKFGDRIMEPPIGLYVVCVKMWPSKRQPAVLVPF